MIGLALGLILWCPAIAGLGIVVRWVSGDGDFRRNCRPTPLDAIAGYLTLAVVAIGLNFFIPLGRTAAAGVLVIGWLLLALSAGSSLWPTSRDLRRWATVVVVASIVCAQPVHYNYDAALYHLQTMKWLQESVLPTGLANLHGRFGYNSAWLTIAALVRDPFDRTPLAHAILLPATAIVFTGIACLRLIATRKYDRLDSRVALTGLLSLASGSLIAALGSPAQDVVVLAAWLIGITLLAKAIESPTDELRIVRSLIWIAALGTIVKLSAAPLWFLPLAAVVRSRAHLRLGSLRGAALVAFIGIGFWSMRATAVSGCVVYPAAATCVPGLPWQVNPQKVRWEAQAIIAWARAPGDDSAQLAASSAWIRPWASRVLQDGDVRIALALLGAALLSLRLGARVSVDVWKQFAWLSASAFLAIGYWLLTAPDPRFVAGPIIAIGVSAMATIGYAAWSRSKTQALPRAVWALVVIAWFPSALELAQAMTRPLRNPGIRILLADPWPIMMKTPRMGISLTARGDTVWRPFRSTDDQCFIAPLPCAPYSVDGLEIIRDAAGRITSFRRP